MATKNWCANAVTAEADVVAPAANKAVVIASLYLCNTSTTATVNAVVKITDSANATKATIAKPVLPPGGTYSLSALALGAAASPDKIRVSADNAVSCCASGDES